MTIPRALFGFVMILPMFSILAGCGRATKPLNDGRAHEILEDFLTAWKDGKKIEEISSKIQGDDPSWRGGLTLVTYEIEPQEVKSAGNLFLTVNRTIKDQKNRQSNDRVTYIVSTSPFSVTLQQD
jgi:hypothetical protein